MKRFIRPTLWALAAALSFAPLAQAQGTEEKPPAPRFQGEANVNEVLMDVLVTDAKGNVIVGLDKSDFVVRENGKPVDLTGVTFYSNRRFLQSADALKKKGELYREARNGDLVLGYRRDDFVRETIISSSEAAVDDSGLSFQVEVPEHGEWQTCIDVVPQAGGPVRAKHGHGSISSPMPNMKLSLNEWIEQAPQLESSWDKLGHIYWRSLVDLAALRFYPEVLPDASVPAVA